MLEDLTLDGKIEHILTTIDAIVPEKKGQLVLIGQISPNSRTYVRESDSMTMAYFAMDVVSDEDRSIAKNRGYDEGHFYRRADIQKMRHIFSGFSCELSRDTNYFLYASLNNPMRKKEIVPINPNNFEETINRLEKDYKGGFITGLVQIPDDEMLRLSMGLREALKQAGIVKKELAKYA